MRLLLTDLGLLQPTEQYDKIKIRERYTREAEIKGNLEKKEEKRENQGLLSNATPNATLQPFTTDPLLDAKPISLKFDNKDFLALNHNLPHHIRTKHVDIQQYHICDKVAS